MREYGTPVYSAIRKAAAPMIGGMICPPVDAAASTAPANSGLYPVLIIIGMVTEPVVTVLPTEEPETIPHRAEEITATFAGPPAGRTCHTVCQINKKRGDAGSLQERPENDKYHNIFLTYVDRSVHHTVGGVKQIVNNFTKTDIGKGVDQQRAYDKKDRKAHAASAKLDQHQDRHDSQSQHKRILRNDTVAGQQNLLGIVPQSRETGLLLPSSAQRHTMGCGSPAHGLFSPDSSKIR